MGYLDGGYICLSLYILVVMRENCTWDRRPSKGVDVASLVVSVNAANDK